MIKSFFNKMYTHATNLNYRNIKNLLHYSPEAKFLDLGCDDGVLSIEFANKLGTKNVYGVDLVDERIEIAKKNGVTVAKSDLNQPFPYESNFFDVIHANQVIEHIAFLDNFAAEIYRVLKPGGYVIISTENGSSWHNIFASILGWQIFSLTNISSKKAGIGNPMAIHRDEEIQWGTWTHKTIFNYKGLIEFFKAHGFMNIEIKGAGYYPLPAFFGNIEKTHSHFITIKAVKK